MPELADIFRLYGQKYRAQFGSRMLPSHLKAMWDIEHCRTEALGGHVYVCEDCNQSHYQYHSCQNRHCPKCMNDRAEIWLQKQSQLLLPTHYFLITFTLPDELRDLARSNQKLFYDLLFKTSSQALLELAADPRFVGGAIGMMGVLHTWARDLAFHPHVHYIVPGGAISVDHSKWLPSHKRFFVHVKPLSRLFRAKFKDELKKNQLFDFVLPKVWEKDWVVNSKPVGNGEHALKYLAPYVYRVALSNKRITKLEHDQVTFEYQDSKTGQSRPCTLPALEFLRRFLQHILPHRFIKIRYYGFLSPTHKETFNQAKSLLLALITLTLNPLEDPSLNPYPLKDSGEKSDLLICPYCGGTLRWLKAIPRGSRAPPLCKTS